LPGTGGNNGPNTNAAKGGAVSEPANTRPYQTVAQDGSSTDGASTGELVAQASRQISDLVRQELTLAKTELVDKGKHFGLGTGLFGGAGVFAVYGGAVLLAAAVAALSLVWPVWLAALVIGVALLVIAGILALTGRKQLRRAVPPMPEQAAASVKSDVHEIKDHLSERHR
jgi:tetrahydromethanopterin S-methyltransferase subunit C